MRAGAAHASPRPWDPARPEAPELPDHGRGLLDAFALGLHLLWTYQEGWGDEGFIANAQLTASVRRLLELVGYHPDPGFAAWGLQHFQIKEGSSTTLPPGFRVMAKAEGDLAASVYETLHALVVSSTRNAMQPFLPVPAESPSTTGAVATAIGPAVPFPQVPQPSPFGGPDALLDQLRDRLAAAWAGTLAEYNAAQARQKALRVADVLRDLQDQGAVDLCGEAFDRMCEELCEAQRLANAAAEPTVGPLSQSQELLLGRLAAMAARQPSAIEAFQSALGQCEGESLEDWSRRLDQMTGFLDALGVEHPARSARPGRSSARITRVLTQLDRALGPTPSDLGIAAPGTDTLFVLPVPGVDGLPPTTHTELLRPGQWLIVGEDVDQVGPDGATVTRRVHREAVQVLRVPRRDPRELARTSDAPHVHATVRPSLLARAGTVLLGNVAEITHGTSVTTEQRWTTDSPLSVELANTSLTWRRATACDDAEGRIPDIELTVAGEPWERRTDLRGSDPTEPVFAVEITADGGTRLRVGDGREGTAVPDGAMLAIRARTGIGLDGNRVAGAIDGIGSVDPAVATTFNPLVVTGGVGPETDDISKARCGGRGARARPAISVGDVRSLSLSFGAVRRAAVYRDARRHRDRMNVVVLDGRGQPLDDTELEALRGYLVARMPPGSSATVANGTHVMVRLGLVVAVEPGRDPLAVLREVRVRLGADPDESAPPGLLAPGRPELGEDVNLSDVYAALDGVPWLVSSHVTHLHRDDESPTRRDRITITDTAVPVWGSAQAGVEAVSIAWEEAVDR